MAWREENIRKAQWLEILTTCCTDLTTTTMMKKLTRRLPCLRRRFYLVNLILVYVCIYFPLLGAGSCDDIVCVRTRRFCESSSRPSPRPAAPSPSTAVSTAWWSAKCACNVFAHTPFTLCAMCVYDGRPQESSKKVILCWTNDWGYIYIYISTYHYLHFIVETVGHRLVQ